MSSNELILEISQIASTTVINVAGLWFLVWYRVNRKFKKEKNETWRQGFEAYWVEIVITAVVVPQWPDAIRGVIKLLKAF
jgi:hypothetical protein